MSRIYLHVPFAERAEAKRLGARWDATSKSWLVSEGADPGKLQKWTVRGPRANVRAARYFIAETSKECWTCGRLTRVFGFLLPEGHQTLRGGSVEAGASREWSTVDRAALVDFVSSMSKPVKSQMDAITYQYREDYSASTESSYCMNHCEHCGAKQGDFEIYEDPEGPFLPLDRDQAEKISLRPVNEPFEASCGGFGRGVAFFEFMRRA